MTKLGELLTKESGPVMSAIGGGLKGVAEGIGSTYRGIGRATAGAAKGIKDEYPGVGGSIAAGVMRATPWVAGAAGTNYLLGDPVGDRYEEEKKRLRARLAATRSVWDRSRNMMV